MYDQSQLRRLQLEDDECTFVKPNRHPVMIRPHFRFAILAVLSLAVGCAGSRGTGPTTQAGWDGATIVIGVDALRWDYTEQFDLETIRQIGDRGVRAELIPVFPSKTFPNFYALATGLFANHSGILDNTMYDPDLGSRFRIGDTTAVRNSAWWKGEPIWVTAEKQGVRSAVFFWPGSEADIEGYRPSDWRHYDGSVEGSDRIDQVLQWLTAPEPERPRLVMIYFSAVDDAGHRFGPLAPETGDAARGIDALVRVLQSGLDKEGLSEKVNVVVVSDHGMTARSENRVIFLDDFVDLRSAGVISLGEHVTLWPQPEAVDSVYLALAGAHPALKVYKRDDLPPRFQLAGNPRTPPIVAVPDLGWTVSTHERADRRAGQFSGGAHGYDNAEPDMHATFAAEGPAFRSSVRLDTLRAVDVYNLLAHSLGLQPAPNDGDPSVVSKLMMP